MDTFIKILFGIGFIVALYFAFVGLFYFIIALSLVGVTLFVVQKIKEKFGKGKGNSKVSYYIHKP